MYSRHIFFPYIIDKCEIDAIYNITVRYSTLQPEKIPIDTKFLIFGVYKPNINKDTIPMGVKYLAFDHDFSQTISPDFIPNSVTHLLLTSLTNIICIPTSVMHLVFGVSFNENINIGTIPNTVTHLTFGEKYNNSIIPGSIPDSVTHLTFGENFNQSIIPESIPKSVTCLRIGKKFNNFLGLHTLSENSPDLSLTFTHFKWKSVNNAEIPIFIESLTFLNSYFVPHANYDMMHHLRELNCDNHCVNFPPNLIVNVFDYGHNKQIIFGKSQLNSDDYIIDNEYNSYLYNYLPITVKKIIPKNIMIQNNTKSAKKN